MFKTSNVGPIDRVIRILIGAIAIALPFLPQTAGSSAFEYLVFKYGIVVVGVVLILTAVVRFCPAYRLIGVNTCRP